MRDLPRCERACPPSTRVAEPPRPLRAKCAALAAQAVLVLAATSATAHNVATDKTTGLTWHVYAVGSGLTSIRYSVAPMVPPDAADVRSGEVDRVTGTTSAPSVAVTGGEASAVFVEYGDGHGSRLVHAEWTGHRWEAAPVLTTRDRLSAPTVARGAAGDVVIAFQDWSRVTAAGGASLKLITGTGRPLQFGPPRQVATGLAVPSAGPEVCYADHGGLLAWWSPTVSGGAKLLSAVISAGAVGKPFEVASLTYDQLPQLDGGSLEVTCLPDGLASVSFMVAGPCAVTYRATVSLIEARTIELTRNNSCAR